MVTALWGAWFIATLGAGRPAALVFARPFMEGRKLLGSASWDQLWLTEPGFRRIWRVSTVIWGPGCSPTRRSGS